MQLPTNKNIIILTGIILFFLFANIIWIQKDKAPPMWDQAEYLDNSQMLYHVLTTEGIASFAKAFSTVLPKKAPLITILPVPSYLIFGNDYKSARYVNLFFIILGSIYLYKLGVLVAGGKAALLSIVVLNTFPLIVGISREVLVEYGLMVFVTMWMYYLLKSECIIHKQYNYRLGIVLGLGMLMKISYPLYIIAPTLFCLWKKIKEQKELTKLMLKNMLFVSLCGFLISGPWYFNNLESILTFAFQSGYGEAAKNWGIGAVFSVNTIIEYWTSLINYGISFYFFLCLTGIVILRLVYFIKENKSIREDPFYRYFLLLWFVVPFLVFTFGVNKDNRYTAPYYPAIALFISANLVQFFQNRHRNVALTVFMLFPVFNYMFMSFSAKPFGLHVNKFILLDSRLGYAHPPSGDRWPLERFIDFVHKDAMRTNNDFAVSTLLFNNEHFNACNLTYYARNINSGLMFNSPPSNLHIDEAVDRIERESSYLFTKSDELGPDFTITQNMLVIAFLERGKMNFKQLATFSLPDRTTVTVYKRDTKDFVYSGIREIKDHAIDTEKAVNFAGKMKLLDYKYERKDDGLKLLLFWQCIDRIDLNYTIFVHIKDKDNNAITNADHCPGKKIYPTSHWRIGEVIKDDIYVPARLPEEFHIDIGIYEETLNSRLLVKDRPGDHQDNIRGVRLYY